MKSTVIDYSKLSSLVKDAMGERNMTQFSKDTGVSVSHISRLINQKLKAIPSPEILAKLIKSKNAKPRGGVTYEDIMIAAGYQEHNTDDFKQLMRDFFDYKDNSVYELSSEDIMAYCLNNRADLNEYLFKLKEENLKATRFKAIARGVIYDYIAKSGITFQSPPVDESSIKGYLPDTILKVTSQVFDLWLFDFLYIYEKNDWRWYRRSCSDLLGKLVLLKPDPKKVVTIITNSKQSFDYLSSLTGNISYYGNLSILLIDIENVNIIEELFISNLSDVEKLPLVSKLGHPEKT